MPRPRSSLNELVQKFGSEVFSCSEDTIRREPCSKALPTTRKFTLAQHVATAKHKESLRLRETQSINRSERLESAGQASRKISLHNPGFRFWLGYLRRLGLVDSEACCSWHVHARTHARAGCPFEVVWVAGAAGSSDIKRLDRKSF